MSTTASAEHACARVLEQLLTRARARPVKVTAVTREPSPFATVFPAEVLTVTLDHGEQVRLFLKHLGPEQSDHPEKERRDREIRVYEELLGAPGLPVVRLYGCVWNAAGGRHDLYLEYIDDWSLRYQELAYWYEAARQLARLHAHFAARVEELRRHDWLLRFEAPWFHAWAARALVAARAESPGLAAALGPVIGDYRPVARLLAAQPMTLVHNDVAPKNVLVDRAVTPARVCFVDWEMAGIGCGLLDLVDLKHGLDPDGDARMCAAYRDALAGTGLLPASPDELRRLLAACELHRTLYRVAFGRSWGVPGGRIAMWVDDARHLRAAFDAGDGQPEAPCR